MRPDWIELDGTANTRDTGGLPTTDGRRTLSRRLLRSDGLQELSPADVRRLVAEYGVRTVVDLRAAIEVKATGPGPLTAEPLVTITNLSLFPERNDHIVPMSERRPAVGRGFSGLYLGFLAERPESVVAALRLIAYGAGTVLVHCTAGKDRTGVVVAALLRAVGVTRSAIVTDYRATEPALPAIIARASHLTDRMDPTVAQRMMGVQAPAVLAVLDVLDGHPDGAWGWLRAAGAREDDLIAWRHRIVPVGQA
ncbi:MAG TPA: tyrosine-protein phosphatase [Trebonia sp.]